MQNTCSTCPRPVPDTAFGCTHCAADLAKRLDQLAGLLPELDVTIAKLDRIGSGGGPRPAGAEIALPYRPNVAERRDAIRNELTTWARMVHEETGRAFAGDTLPSHARYLTQAVDWARYRQQWAEFHAGLRPLAGSLLGVIDRPAERVYLGPCRTVDDETGETCWADVLATPGAAVGRCRQCNAVHEVAEAKGWLLKCLENHLAGTVELTGIFQRLGVKIGYSTIARYVSRRQLLPHGQDGHGRDLFRIGDVLDLRIGSDRQGSRAA